MTSGSFTVHRQYPVADKKCWNMICEKKVFDAKKYLFPKELMHDDGG